MQIDPTLSRYRIFDTNSQQPMFAEDGGDKDKKDTSHDSPKKGDFKDQDDDDLKNVDQSRGGYGDDTGFDKE